MKASKVDNDGKTIKVKTRSSIFIYQLLPYDIRIGAVRVLKSKNHYISQEKTKKLNQCWP